MDRADHCTRSGSWTRWPGGTRAAAYTARGEWTLAWRYNPLGILVVLAAAGAVLRAVVGVLTRRWVKVTVTWDAATGQGGGGHRDRSAGCHDRAPAAAG